MVSPQYMRTYDVLEGVGRAGHEMSGPNPEPLGSRGGIWVAYTYTSPPLGRVSKERVQDLRCVRKVLIRQPGPLADVAAFPLDQ